METLGRKARNLTGRPLDSSAARNYLLCGFLYFEGKGMNAFWIFIRGSKKRERTTYLVYTKFFTVSMDKIRYITFVVQGIFSSIFIASKTSSAIVSLFGYPEYVL